MALEFIMVPVNLTGMDTKTDDFVLNPGAASEMKNVWMDRSGKYQTRYGYAELAPTVADGVTVSDWHGDILRWRKTTAEKIDTAGIRPTNASFLAGKYSTYDVGGDIEIFNDFTDEFSYAEGPDYGVFIKSIVTLAGEGIELQFVDLESKKCFYSTQIASKTIAGPTTFNTTRGMAVSTPTGVAVLMWEPTTGAYLALDYWVGFDGSGYPTRTLENVILHANVTLDRVDAVHINGYITAVYITGADTYLARANLGAGTAANSQISADLPSIVAIAAKDSTTGVAIWAVRTGAGPYDIAFKRRDFSVSAGPTGTATTIVTHASVSPAFDPERISILWDGSLYHMAWDWDGNAGAAGGSYPGPNTTEYYTSASGTRNALDRRAQIASRLFLYSGEVCMYESSTKVSGDDTNISLALRTFGSPSWPMWTDYLFQGRTRPGSVSGALPEVVVDGTTITTALPWAGNQKNQAKVVVREPVGKPMFGYWNRVLMHNVTPHLECFDGRKSFPAGFPTWPVITSVVASGSGSFTGTYGFSAIWERVDNEGNVWRSAPSLVVTEVASSNSQFLITIEPPPFYTLDSDYFQLVVYRTAANGSIFYRALSEIAFPVITATVDTFPDSELTAQPLIYTDGGALENVMPPAVESWGIARDRAFIISAEDQNLYPSKLRIPGEGLGFSDALRISLQGDGSLRAVAGMDDKVVVWGDESHTVLYGVGPDDFGAGQFEQQMMSDDVGCVDPRSVILGDKGLFFQSRKGLWLIGRDLSSQPVGIPMDIYKGETFVGAMSPSDRMFHWWYLASGTILVYDEYHTRWSRFKTDPAMGSALVDQKPVFMTDTGNVWREDTTLYTDDGVAYECQATLGWLSFAGLQGFQKIRRVSILGESQVGAFNVVCKLAYDFVSTTVETITAANTTVKPTGTAYTWEFKPQRQKCESIRADFSWTSSGSGAAIVGLAFEVGGIPGIARRIKTAKRVKGV